MGTKFGKANESITDKSHYTISISIRHFEPDRAGNQSSRATSPDTTTLTWACEASGSSRKRVGSLVVKQSLQRYL